MRKHESLCIYAAALLTILYIVVFLLLHAAHGAFYSVPSSTHHFPVSVIIKLKRPDSADSVCCLSALERLLNGAADLDQWYGALYLDSRRPVWRMCR